MLFSICYTTGTVILGEAIPGLRYFEVVILKYLRKFVASYTWYAFINLVIMHELDRLPAVTESGDLNTVAVPCQWTRSLVRVFQSNWSTPSCAPEQP